MKDALIKSIKNAITKHRVTNDGGVHYAVVNEGVPNKFDYQIIVFFKKDKTVIDFWIGIVGKPKIEISSLEVEPMDKDGAVAFAKNHLIEKLKEIL